MPHDRKPRAGRRARVGTPISRRRKVRTPVGVQRQAQRRSSRGKGKPRFGTLFASAAAWLAVIAAFPAAFLLLWFAVNNSGWVGPFLADAARSLVGTEAVSRLEDFAYGVQDRWNGWWRSSAKPEAHWDAPPADVETPATPSNDENQSSASSPSSEVADFHPDDVGPLFQEMAAPGDGRWVPVRDPAHPDDAPLMFKTLLHPDRRRSWSELFVVAIDLRRTQLYAVAGTLEPKASTEEGAAYKRRGLVPEARQNALLAAFDGGFKAEHGQWGMKVDGVTLLPPREHGCTVVSYSDHSLRIGTWSAVADTASEMSFWRQTPSCMVEDGVLNPGLANEGSISWGAALGGGTVVRRSAIGLDAQRNVLFMGVSNATTARVLAMGMQHVGASEVAQLDINWSYPHFIMFRPPKGGARQGFSLFDGFAYEEKQYITRPSQRDFFYLVRKDASLSQRER
jgi:hypothetical protein